MKFSNFFPRFLSALEEVFARENIFPKSWAERGRKEIMTTEICWCRITLMSKNIIWIELSEVKTVDEEGGKLLKKLSRWERRSFRPCEIKDDTAWYRGRRKLWKFFWWQLVQSKIGVSSSDELLGWNLDCQHGWLGSKTSIGLIAWMRAINDCHKVWNFAEMFSNDKNLS